MTPAGTNREHNGGVPKSTIRGTVLPMCYGSWWLKLPSPFSLWTICAPSAWLLRVSVGLKSQGPGHSSTQQPSLQSCSSFSAHFPSPFFQITSPKGKNLDKIAKIRNLESHLPRQRARSLKPWNRKVPSESPAVARCDSGPAGPWRSVPPEGESATVEGHGRLSLEQNPRPMETLSSFLMGLIVVNYLLG